jgi:hypothetical protein
MSSQIASAANSLDDSLFDDALDAELAGEAEIRTSPGRPS